MNLSDTHKWILGLGGSLLLSATGLYAGWINGNFTAQAKVNEKVTLHNVDMDFDVEILDAKLDLILKDRGLHYEGPVLRTHRNHLESK